METDKPAIRPLAILLVAAGLLGIYKLWTSACISNDSVLFLEFAKQLADSPLKAIRTYDQHPGFPWMLYAARQVVQIFCGPIQSAEGNILLGQGVVLLCRLLALAVIYLIFIRLGRRQTAFLNTLFVLLIPKFANHGSDVLSDWPALLFEALSLLLCLKGIASPCFRYFLISGTAAGLAFWIRPEGLIFVPVFWLYILIRSIWFSDNRKKHCLHGLTMTLAALAVISPYILIKEAIFPKKNIGRFTQKIIVQEPMPAIENATLLAEISHPFASAAISRTAEGMVHFLKSAFNLLWLMIVPWGYQAIRTILSFRKNTPVQQFLALFIILWMVLLLGLFVFYGYISNRHLMPLVVFSSGLLWEGIVQTLRPLSRPPCRLRIYVYLFLAAALLPWIVKLLQPLHIKKSVYKQVGLWLEQTVPIDHQLAVVDNRIGFYAQRQYKIASPSALRSAQWAVLSNPPDPSLSIPPTAIPIRTDIPSIDEQIQIFRLPPKKPSPH